MDVLTALDAYHKEDRKCKRLERKAMQWRELGLTKEQALPLWNAVDIQRDTVTQALDRYIQIRGY